MDPFEELARAAELLRRHAAESATHYETAAIPDFDTRLTQAAGQLGGLRDSFGGLLNQARANAQDHADRARQHAEAKAAAKAAREARDRTPDADILPGFRAEHQLAEAEFRDLVRSLIQDVKARRSPDADHAMDREVWQDWKDFE